MGYKGTGKAFYHQYFAGAKGITANTSLLANDLAGRCTAPRVGDDGRYYKAVRANWECRRCAGLRYYKPIHDKDLVDTIENLCQSPAVA
jgi:hypothetical protein